MAQQQFQVLRCCSCLVFQVQQVKKSKTWNCKVCDQKQSILKIFGQGSGSDCRHHVQKLNLLQGEVEQVPANLPGCIEEPVEGGDENIALNLEDKLNWQEKNVDLVSRWTKYLDKRYEEPEKEDTGEVLMSSEKRICSSKRNMVEHSRKHKKTRLCTRDTWGSEERSVSGFAKDVKCFEDESNSDTMGIKSCGEATCESVMLPAEEQERVRHREDTDVQSRAVGPSKWEKFLLPGKSCHSSTAAVTTQERRGMLVPGPAAGASAARAAVSSGTCHGNQHHASQQPEAIPFDRTQQDSTIDCTAIASIPREAYHAPALVKVHHLQERVPDQSISIPSVSPTISNSKNLYRNLFSTGDDFDDDI
ncbi:MRN complex-interacting protein [Varanus komodoensis]|uniref:MRN complex-interacting protein n=1 Tax=Varanus komodoensis TaxID=61221 RepID=UPI001CF7984A|nr:MRN complex-interacting protein [Varanus komodoensis]